MDTPYYPNSTAMPIIVSRECSTCSSNQAAKKHLIVWVTVGAGTGHSNNFVTNGKVLLESFGGSIAVIMYAHECVILRSLVI